MFKRFISLILALVLLLGAAHSNAEMVSNKLLEVEDETIAWEICVHKGDIYTIYRSKALMKFNAETKKFEAVGLFESKEDTEQNEHKVLLSDGEKLYTITNEELAEIFVEDEKIISKTLIEFDKKNANYGYNRVINNGVLYQVFYDDSTGRPGIRIIDIATQKVDNIEVDGHIYGIGAYKDSIYLFNGEYELFVLEGREFKAIHESLDEETREVLYDKNTDTFYQVAYNRVISKIEADGKLTPITLLPIEYGKAILDDNSNLVVLLSSEIAEDEDLIQRFDIKSLKMPEKTLKVSGNFMPKLMKKYNNIHTDMPAVSIDLSDFNIAKIAEAMKSENQPDVIFLEYHYGVDNLIKHDYTEPIKDEELLAKINRMYPYIKDALNNNGEYYVFPYNVYSYNEESSIRNYAYNKEAWSRLGLSENDVPKTYAEFISFLENYQTKFANPDIQLFNNMLYKDIRNELKIRLINEALIASSIKGEIPSYNTPELQQLFTMLDNAKFEGFFDPKIRDMEYIQESEEKTVLFRFTEDIMDIPDGYALMPLALSDGSQTHNVANMTVMFVNSLSENKEQAFEFIKFISDNLSQRSQTYMYTDVNELALNQDVVRSIKHIEKNIEKKQKKLEEMKASNDKGAKALEEELEFLQKDLENFKQHSYTINQEELDALQANSANIYIQKNMAFNWQNEEMNKLLEQLYNQESPISSQQFLTELDRITKMSFLEGN